MLQRDDGVRELQRPKQKLYRRVVFELVPFYKGIHYIFSNEDNFGLSRIIGENDPEFKYLLQGKDYFDEYRRKTYGGIPVPFVAYSSCRFKNPRMQTFESKLYEINPEQKIIIPTNLNFGRVFGGHVDEDWFWKGTEKEFFDELEHEGYRFID